MGILEFRTQLRENQRLNHIIIKIKDTYTYTYLNLIMGDEGSRELPKIN